MNSDDRHIMSTRSTLRPTTNEIRNKIGTPVTEVYHPQEAWGRSETILKRHMSNKLAWNNGQERKWNRQHRRTSVGDMSARRCDVTGYGSQVFVEFRKDHPLPEETGLVAGLEPKVQARVDAEVHEHKRRPLTSYCKLQFSGQTFLVPETANQPPQRRIFLDTHYTPWEGRTVGIRAPSRSETLHHRPSRALTGTGPGAPRSASSLA